MSATDVVITLAAVAALALIGRWMARIDPDREREKWRARRDV